MHLFGCTIFIQNVWAHAFAEAGILEIML